ncbi:MAG: SUMF1/EgtB/PvdO family nonheme iron enzyme [Chloroflexi bacterium]|nr:SUMF1/EgtB/PvdO family nonheme iron enzyme [Chloroflexota bacterium]
MRCTVCGQDNRPSARFCSQCRAPLPGAADSALLPGQTMNNGQYRVVRKLGKGGMGAIYLAANTQAFDRLAVVKEMLAYYEPGQEAQARERFEREARTLAALKHPGIPDMYGFFSERGHNYIVMEYIEGEDLAEHLSETDDQGNVIHGKALALEDVLRYGVEICRVLEYLSSVQPEPVVHNDIKPANIIIDRNSNQAVLVDFGTAKTRYMVDPGGKVGRRQSDTYGTVGYAPPEQYQGRTVPKSDVYALAATLYHLLTDDDPRDHPHQFPRLADTPAGLRLVLERALANEVDQRLDATEFRRQLEAVRASLSGTTQPIAFPGGDVATTVTGMLDLSLKHWDYARQRLYDGSLDGWLRGAIYNPIAADQAKQAVLRYPEESDAGLDVFLRALNPRLPAPKLQVIDRTLDFGAIEPGESATVTLSLVNLSPAGAHGELSSSEPWLRVNGPAFGLPPQGRRDIAVEVTGTGALLPGQRYRGALTLRPEGGAPVAVEVAGRVVEHIPTQALRPPAAAPQAQPKPRPQPRPQAKPQAQPKRRSGALWIVLALLVLAAGGYWLWNNTPLGSADVAGGLEALRAEDWPRAQRLLRDVDPADAEAVDLLGRALDLQVVEVVGGELLMGREEGQADERPEHLVAVASFRISRFEVTNAQYQRFVAATGHAAPRGWANGRYPQSQALWPVVGVSWEDARDYGAWLGSTLGADIRLPSEAEWEWAARGAEGRLYPWGDEDRPDCRNAGRGEGGPVAVGSYPCGASIFGLQDLAGNVREWVADAYAPYRDPHDPPASGSRRVIRGGSWSGYNVTSTAREHAPAGEKADDLGFRVAWTAP